MIWAVPSKGRAGKVTTLKVAPFAILFVPEYEVSSYKKCHPNAEIRGVPAEVHGITKTRNWILDNADDDSVVMVDDDVRQHGWCKMHDENTEHKKLTPQQWWDESLRLFDITRQLKLRLWGVATQAGSRSVYTYKPFLFRSYVTASCCGICNETGLRFDEEFVVKEDYELNLRCIVEDGGVVAARHLYWCNSHWHDDGGCKDYRTQRLEKTMIDKLKNKYPSMVRRVKRGGSEWSIELVF